MTEYETPAEDELIIEDEPTREAPQTRGESVRVDTRPFPPPLPLPPPASANLARPPASPGGSHPTGLPKRDQYDDLNPFHPGDVISGKYRVERIVGRIGVGLLAQVRHVELGQRLSLKCLPRDRHEQHEAASRFLRGAKLAMRLTGEHVVRTVDAGRLASGVPYVISEAIPGADLRGVLRIRGPLSVSEAVDFMIQAADACAEAHALGLVHKNLNPSTLLYTRRPDGTRTIRVSDFGIGDVLRGDIARAYDASGDAATFFGSNPLVDALSCAAPEQLRGLPDIDARADIWSLGAILHELLCGAPAFQADSVPGILASVAADPAPPITGLRSDVPGGLEAVILRCLAKDKEARYPSLADLVNALLPFTSPDLRAMVDRITRTVARGAHSQRVVSASRALVHVGPSPQPANPRVVSTPSNIQLLVWSTALVAFGLVGGTVAGVLLATRTGLSGASRAEVIESRIAAAQAAPAPAPTSIAPSANAVTTAAVSLEPPTSLSKSEPARAPTAPPTLPSAVPSTPAPRRVKSTSGGRPAVPTTAVAEDITASAEKREAATPIAQSRGATQSDALFDSMR